MNKISVYLCALLVSCAASAQVTNWTTVSNLEINASHADVAASATLAPDYLPLSGATPMSGTLETGFSLGLYFQTEGVGLHVVAADYLDISGLYFTSDMGHSWILPYCLNNQDMIFASTADIANALAGLGGSVSFATNSAYATNSGHAATAGAATDLTARATAAVALTNWTTTTDALYPRSNPSNYVASSTLASGLTAGSNYAVTVANAASSGAIAVSAAAITAATNGLVTASVTNGLASTAALGSGLTAGSNYAVTVANAASNGAVSIAAAALASGLTAGSNYAVTVANAASNGAVSIAAAALTTVVTTATNALSLANAKPSYNDVTNTVTHFTWPSFPVADIGRTNAAVTMVLSNDVLYLYGN